MSHPLAVGSIEWQPDILRARDGTEQAVERGSIIVPESRSKAGQEITLRFARIKSPNPTGPPVVFLSGGPGESGIQWASHGPFLRVFQRVAQGADLILLDQRGTGSSERDLSIGASEIQPDDLSSHDHMLVLLGRHVGKAAARLRKLGALLKAYTAVESALDLDDLRVALGVGSISLWGYSYGTHLAQIAAKRLLGRINRIVLCGFEGPDQTFKLPHVMDAQIARLDIFCPGFQANLITAIRTLDEAPIEVDGIRFGSFALKHLVANWCGISNRFTRLPALAKSLAERQPEVLAMNLADYLRLWARPLTFYLTDAASGATLARWEKIREQEPFSLLGQATNFPFPDVNPMIEPADMGDDMRKPLKTTLPMLVFTGSLDGFTPTENASATLRNLPEAMLLVVENAAHNDLVSSQDGVEAIAEFLATGNHLPQKELRIDPPAF